jgi:hypothetical protein
MSDRQDSVPGEAEPVPETEHPAMPVEAAAATIDAAIEALKRVPAGTEDQKAEPQGDLFAANVAGEARPAPLITIAPADSPIAGPPRERSRSGRFALLAASLALAGAIGAMAGTLGATSLAWVAPGMTGSAVAARGNAEDEAVRANLAQVTSELAALKAAIESANRVSGTQFAKIGTRIDRIERSTAEPAAKLAKAIETINRLDRRGAVAAASSAPATTASAAPAATPVPAPTPAVAARAAPDITGSIPLPRPKAARPTTSDGAPPAAVLRGWRVRDVFDGMALIQGRLGVIEVVPGDILPGLGEIRAVERQQGHWVVVTSRGVIISR